jgi:hypothetical protein
MRNDGVFWGWMEYYRILHPSPKKFKIISKGDHIYMELLLNLMDFGFKTTLFQTYKIMILHEKVMVLFYEAIIVILITNSL